LRVKKPFWRHTRRAFVAVTHYAKETIHMVKRRTIHMKGWITCEDGGSGRWLYARPLDVSAKNWKRGFSANVWAFICLDDMVDACGQDADYYFSASVSVVDLTVIPTEAQQAALSSCGAAGWTLETLNEKYWLAVAHCCHDHGNRAPCWEGASPAINKSKRKHWKWEVPSDTSPTFTQLRAAARRFAEENLLDVTQRAALLNTRVVNAIGQTALEYSTGTDGLWNALRRIKQDPGASKEQKLTLATYQRATQTLGAGPVPADIMEE
jgi:hypothetical protein